MCGSERLRNRIPTDDGRLPRHTGAAGLAPLGTPIALGGAFEPSLPRFDSLVKSLMERSLVQSRFLSLSSLAAMLLASVTHAHGLNATNDDSFEFAQSSSCAASWLPTFGAELGADSIIHALTVFDDGNGSDLYAGGQFATVAGREMNAIARWDGSDWTPLGIGMNGTVHALTAYDDGSGAALYAAGNFTTAGGVPANRIAKWDGSSWSSLGGGLTAGAETVDSLAVYDDGGGAELYVGGSFLLADGLAANGIAKWDGSSWAVLGTGSMVGVGLNGIVHSMAVFDDGSGAELFVGGLFTSAGGTAANNIARWNGSVFTPLAAGTDSDVRALTVFDDGSGPAVYAGGKFQDAGSVAASRIAKWDGSSWTALGSGLGSFSVEALQVYDDGVETALYVGGFFNSAGGTPAKMITKWNGTTWTDLGSDMERGVEALAVFDDGNGADLYVGGTFTGAGGALVGRVASWDGSNWSKLRVDVSGDIVAGRVKAIAVFDDGGGPDLYVAGHLRADLGWAGSNIVRWDGAAWTPVGSGVNGTVDALVVFDDGTGPALYAGGGFGIAGGEQARRVAKWNGSSWAPLGVGMDAPVYDLEVFDDGSGPALFAAGMFTTAGGVPAGGIAKWDGSSWSALGNGPGAFTLRALAVFDDGSGTALHAAGLSDITGATSFDLVHRWNGSSWSTLNSGPGNYSSLSGTVNSMTVFDDGGGKDLIAAGSFRFDLSGGAGVMNSIGEWDGTAWSPLSVLPPSVILPPEVSALASFDDGRGEALYVGGSFTSWNGVPVDNIVKWDGATWMPVGSGILGDVETLATLDDGTGTALFAGGYFRSAIDSRDSFIAKWGCSNNTFEDFCNGDGGNQMGCTDCPCSNNAPQGTVGGCLNGSSMSGRLMGSGSPSAASDTMRFEMSGGNPNGFAILSSGASRAPANASSPCFGLDSGVSFTGFDGVRCVVQSLQRHGTRSMDANGDVGVTTNGWGPPSGPSGGLIAQGGFVAGQTRHYQVVYREAVTLGCGRGLQTSQGVSVTIEL